MRNIDKFNPRYLYMAVFLGLAAIPAGAQPNWSVVSTDYEFTMTVTGIANIDCIESLDTNDIVAAFIGDEVRGVQPVREFYNGHDFAFMIVYDNVFSGSEIHFKIYDASEDKIIDAMGSMTFEENQNVGSTELPHVFRNEPGINQILLNTISISRELQFNEVATTLSALNELNETTDVVYAWIDDASGIDNDLFTLNGNQVRLNVNASEIQDDTLDLHLRATPLNGCALDYAFHLLLTDHSTGLENVDTKESLIVYPNPTSDIIHWNSPTTFENIMLYDLQGKMVFASNLNSRTNMDLSFLAPGTYVVRMLGDGRSEVGIVAKE